MADAFPRRRAYLAGAVYVSLSATTWLLLGDSTLARAIVVALAYLTLALTEIVPPFVPTLLLLVATPLLLGSRGAEYALGSVLTWPAEPVLALFAGGLALSLAAQRHGLDARTRTLPIRGNGSLSAAQIRTHTLTM